MRKGKQIEYFIDDKESSLLEIIENNPDDAVWKSFLEKHGLQRSDSAKRYLKEKLSDYLSAQEISKRTGIKNNILNKWRASGKIESEMLQGRWYYSSKSIVNAIKTADIKDLK